MSARGWPGAAGWARRASTIAPTIVGGSKKHGGADRSTRAKRALAELGVDGLGLADEPPAPWADPALIPRLTCEMVARLQGWQDEWGWEFSGRKTARYRQVGDRSAARCRGGRRRDPASARHAGRPRPLTDESAHLHDPVRGAAGARCVPDGRADRRGRPGRGRDARDSRGRTHLARRPPAPGGPRARLSRRDGDVPRWHGLPARRVQGLPRPGSTMFRQAQSAPRQLRRRHVSTACQRRRISSLSGSGRGSPPATGRLTHRGPTGRAAPSRCSCRSGRARRARRRCGCRAPLAPRAG